VKNGVFWHFSTKKRAFFIIFDVIFIEKMAHTTTYLYRKTVKYFYFFQFFLFFVVDDSNIQ